MREIPIVKQILIMEHQKHKLCNIKTLLERFLLNVRLHNSTETQITFRYSIF